MRASGTSVPSLDVRIVGYSIDSRMKASLAVALDNATAARSPVAAVVASPVWAAKFAHRSSSTCCLTMDYMLPASRQHKQLGEYRGGSEV